MPTYLSSALAHRRRAEQLLAVNPHSRAAALHLRLAALIPDTEEDRRADEYRQALQARAGRDAADDYLGNLGRNLAETREFKHRPGEDAAPDLRHILVMRHGETPMNDPDPSKDRIRGWLDVELTAEGKREALDLAESLSDGDEMPDVLVCSDLTRCVQTAEIVSQATGIPIVWVTAGFRPWNVGRFVGMVTESVVPLLTGHYLEMMPEEPIPGGESFCSFHDRCLAAVAQALVRFQGTIGIVAHSRNERLLESWKAAGYPADGSVDSEVFGEKGESPGECAQFDIPVDRLMAAVAEGR